MWDRWEEWTAGVWKRTCSSKKGGASLAFQTDKYIKGRFFNPMNSKDGFPISKFVDALKCRILEFLVPILYPKKSIGVTIIVENTIFEALKRKRLVD